MRHGSIELLNEIFPGQTFHTANPDCLAKARAYLDSLTKPRGSLGVLEDLAARLCAISGGQKPLKVDPCIMFTVAADHGIAAQNVSPFPQSVTRQMVANFLAEGAAINVLCKNAGISLRIVDAGCAGGPFASHPALLDRRQGDGTNDMSVGPAMNAETCKAAIRTGMDLGMEFAAKGYKCLALGEMGIANSTAASALYCAFLGLSPRDAAGPGAGAGPAMIAHKQQMIARALAANAAAAQSGNPLEILAALGGYEIAVIAGIMLSCACARLPFLVDGFICTSAYVAALSFFPSLSGFAFLSHASAEPGYRLALQKIPGQPRPILNLDLRLGEGTGAALAFPILKAATAIYNDMATLEEAQVSARESDRIG